MIILNGFGYDGLNRLVTADYLAGTVGTEEFNYDLLGNREDSNGYSGYKDTRPDPDVTCSYGNHGNNGHGHNPANEYDKIGGVDVQYDNAGNLTLDKSGMSIIMITRIGSLVSAKTASQRRRSNMMLSVEG
jgi:hypothetical protein